MIISRRVGDNHSKVGSVRRDFKAPINRYFLVRYDLGLGFGAYVPIGAGA